MGYTVLELTKQWQNSNDGTIRSWKSVINFFSLVITTDAAPEAWEATCQIIQNQK
jgi:hypothetical protein